MPTNKRYILALDVGEKRIGLAITSVIAKLPRPYNTINNEVGVWDKLTQIINNESIDMLVVGLPRNLDGGETEQTKYARTFATKLGHHVNLPVVLQDEALTSRKAEAELRSTSKQYDKGAIDSLAATYILEDYLAEQGGSF